MTIPIVLRSFRYYVGMRVDFESARNISLAFFGSFFCNWERPGGFVFYFLLLIISLRFLTLWSSFCVLLISCKNCNFHPIKTSAIVRLREYREMRKMTENCKRQIISRFYFYLNNKKFGMKEKFCTWNYFNFFSLLMKSFSRHFH